MSSNYALQQTGQQARCRRDDTSQHLASRHVVD